MLQCYWYNSIIVWGTNITTQYSLCTYWIHTRKSNFSPLLLFLFQMFFIIFKREVKLRAIQNAIFKIRPRWINPIIPFSQISTHLKCPRLLGLVESALQTENSNREVVQFSARCKAVQQISFAGIAFMAKFHKKCCVTSLVNSGFCVKHFYTICSV